MASTATPEKTQKEENKPTTPRVPPPAGAGPEAMRHEGSTRVRSCVRGVTAPVARRTPAGQRTVLHKKDNLE